MNRSTRSLWLCTRLGRGSACLVIHYRGYTEDDAATEPRRAGGGASYVRRPTGRGYSIGRTRLLGYDSGSINVAYALAYGSDVFGRNGALILRSFDGGQTFVDFLADLGQMLLQLGGSLLGFVVFREGFAEIHKADFQFGCERVRRKEEGEEKAEAFFH